MKKKKKKKRIGERKGPSRVATASGKWSSLPLFGISSD